MEGEFVFIEIHHYINMYLVIALKINLLNLMESDININISFKKMDAKSVCYV